MTFSLQNVKNKTFFVVPRPVIAWMHNVIQNAIASDDDTSYTINANLEPAKVRTHYI